MSDAQELAARTASLLFLLLFGGWFGLLWGASMGLAMGLLLGLSLAVLTRCFFFYDPDPGAHRRAAGRAGAAASRQRAR